LTNFKGEFSVEGFSTPSLGIPETMAPDCTKCTLSELKGVLDYIDKSTYPERYGRAKNEYQKRSNDPKQLEIDNIKKEDSKTSFILIIAVIIVTFFRH